MWILCDEIYERYYCRSRMSYIKGMHQFINFQYINFYLIFQCNWSNCLHYSLIVSRKKKSYSKDKLNEVRFEWVMLVTQLILSFVWRLWRHIFVWKQIIILPYPTITFGEVKFFSLLNQTMIKSKLFDEITTTLIIFSFYCHDISPVSITELSC